MKSFANYITEAKASKIMKRIRGAQGPYTVVVMDGSKVISQEVAKIPTAIPAHIKTARSEYPNSKIAVEDGNGRILHTEATEHTPGMVPFRGPIGFDNRQKAFSAHYRRVHGKSPSKNELRKAGVGMGGDSPAGVKAYKAAMKRLGVKNVSEEIDIEEGESVEDYLKRGGKIKKLKPRAARGSSKGKMKIKGGRGGNSLDLARKAEKKMQREEGTPANAVGGGNVAGTLGDPPVRRTSAKRKKFAGCDVFEVASSIYHSINRAKLRSERFAKFVGEDDTATEIREYARQYPAAGIMIQDEATGAMTYLKHPRGKTGVQF